VIRRASPEDLDDLVALAGSFCHLAQHSFDAEQLIAGLRPLLPDDTLGKVWLVDDPERPGEPSGYAVVTWGWSVAGGGRVCMLDELHVRAHGNGLATRVLAELLEDAQAAGATSAVLETEAHDRRAREFFGASGFDLTDSVFMSLRMTSRDHARP
jgi:ribosomal protein S18 acetylase RimI-like enzyme